jgi:hypothetical protein
MASSQRPLDSQHVMIFCILQSLQAVLLARAGELSALVLAANATEQQHCEQH